MVLLKAIPIFDHIHSVESIGNVLCGMYICLLFSLDDPEIIRYKELYHNYKWYNDLPLITL